MRNFLSGVPAPTYQVRPGTARRAVRTIAPYRRQLACVLAIALLDSALLPVFPLILGALLNDGLIHKNMTVVLVLSGIAGGIMCLKAVTGLLGQWVAVRLGSTIVLDLRIMLFEHLMRQPLDFFMRTDTGRLVNRLRSEVQGVQTAATSVISSIVTDGCTFLIVLAVMLTVSWQVTLAVLAIQPFVIIASRWMAGILARLARERMQQGAGLAAMMTERFNVAGALLVMLYGRHDDEVRDFGDRAASLRSLTIATATYGRILSSIFMIAASAGIVAAYDIGGASVIHGTLSVGSLVALVMLLQLLQQPLTSLAKVPSQFMTSLVSFERLFELLDLETTLEITPGGTEPSFTGAPSVQFSHVNFRYPDPGQVPVASLAVGVPAAPTADTLAPTALVLRDISFRIEPGELVALVGRSGSGKTTLTHLISRLYDATDGTVTMAGQDVRDVDLTRLRREIGVVSQDSYLFHDTIRANLRYAKPLASDDELIAACEAAQIWPVIRSLPSGLDTVVGDRGYRMSGGEKQRLSIARLLLKDPSLVILDEATAHLDAESEVAVQRALQTVLRGRTSVVIAHRLSTVRSASRILVLDEGRIRESGTHHELLAAGGLYAALCETYFGATDDHPTEPAREESAV